jgi:hypothetical protein
VIEKKSREGERTKPGCRIAQAARHPTGRRVNAGPVLPSSCGRVRE